LHNHVPNQFLMNISGKQLTGYAQSAAGEEFLSVITDAEGHPYTFHEATGTEINEAITKAAEAFPLYKHITYAQRADFLERIADEIIAIGRGLISITMQESALPEARLLGERDRTTGQLRFFAKILREGSWLRAVIDLPSADMPAKADLRQMQIPLGVTAVWGASNFPFAFSVAGGDTVSALAGGCPVVHKAHPAHPVTCDLIGQAIIKAAKATNMPDGVFSLLHGANYQTGQQIIRHPLLKAAAFTGSFQGGKALFDEANKRDEPIPVYAEMGSVNPVFILPGIMKEKGTDLAKALAASNLLGVGQFCTNPGVVVLPGEAGDFMNGYSQAITAAAGGMMLTENIHRAFNKGTAEMEKNEGVRLFAKSSASENGRTATPQAFTTTAQAFLADAALGEEVFGPSSIHITTKNKEEILQIARSLKGQLTATIWGNQQDLNDYNDLQAILEDKAGRLIINAMPTGVEVANAMVHGGPFPATTNSASTSVGAAAIYRFTRPVCFQGFPQAALPDALKNDNPLGIMRQVDGKFTTATIS
jgi:alpha-ketoglutaric semialdehyde dehydrogenase